jgi:hypothetical protein
MENNVFGGFEAVASQFLSSTSSEKRIGAEDNETTVDPEDIKKQMEEFDNIDDDKDKNDDEPTEVEVEVKDNKKTAKKVDLVEEDTEDDSKKKPTTETEEKELDIEEVELVTAFSDLFADELGWEFEGDEKPQSIKDLVAYMQDVIENNSQPKYASTEIKELDDFVKQGGNVKDYFSKVYTSEIDPEKIDITKEHNQKLVIKENLRNRGYSEQRIEKLINRYEETGALEEEAKDSLDEVTEYKTKAKKELLEQTKKQAEENVKEQLKFVQSVESIITDSKDIRGIAISEKDKKALVEYIFKPSQDGQTGYQKDYNSNLKNLVESAYFTMKKDTIVQQIQTKASSNAVKDLKLRLKTKGKSTKNTESDLSDNGAKITKLWDIASKDLFGERS